MPGRIPVPDCSTLTPDFANSCKYRIDIVHLEQNVVNAAASLIEEILVRVIRLREAESIRLSTSPNWTKAWLDPNVLFYAAIVVLGFRAIGPLHEAKGSDPEQRAEQLRRLGEIVRPQFRSARSASACTAQGSADDKVDARLLSFESHRAR